MSLDNTVDGLCLRDLALYFSHNFLRCANGKTPLKDIDVKNLNVYGVYIKGLIYYMYIHILKTDHTTNITFHFRVLQQCIKHMYEVIQFYPT